MNNSLISTENTYSAIKVKLLKPGEISINGLKIVNSEVVQAQAVFYATSQSGGSLTINSPQFQNMTLSEKASILSYGILDKVLINGLQTNLVVTKSGDLEVNSCITHYYDSNLAAPNIEQVISNITMEQSSVSMIVLSKPDYDTASTSSLLVSNVTYQNTVSSAGVDIVKIYRMASTGTYEIIFEDITFKNLTFQRNTKLFHLMQQLNTPVDIRNIQVSNVVYAGITVLAYDTNNVGNFTQVNIQNISVTDVDTNLRSFINIYEGANVNVSDSTFQRISNLDSGAVMSAGFQKAIARFYNTSFFNNTSVEGGVFTSQSQSIIECHQCKIYSNFAISSGVIKINSDGIFKFYNSEIYENKAMVASVAELFSTQTQSIVSNCTIRSNQILSSVEVLIQRFVFDSFREYLLDHEYLLEHSENQYKSIPIEYSLLLLPIYLCYKK